MLLAWRRLLHGVITVAMDCLPDAILAPKDQGGSDHGLGRLRPARELPPPALDEDPVSHVASSRQEGGVVRDLARTGHELRRHPESQRSLTSAQPCSTPPQNQHWLMASVWEHSAFMGSGSPLATAVSASWS